MKLLISLLFLSACSHSVHLVHMSGGDILKDSKKGKEVSVLSEQTVIFGFIFDTNYVELAHKGLMDKCPAGEVRNIMTRYSTSHGFFHWKNKIYMKGSCFQ